MVLKILIFIYALGYVVSCVRLARQSRTLRAIDSLENNRRVPASILGTIIILIVSILSWFSVFTVNLES